MRTPLFEGLTDEDMKRVMAQLRRRHVVSGERVIVQGERPGRISIVESGTAHILMADGRGGEHLIGLLGPGSIAGEMSLLTGEPASATVRAVSDLDLLVLDADSFHQVAMMCPLIYRNVAALLSDKLARSNQRLLLSRGEVTVLHDHDAPPLLAFALAASIAWHSSDSVLAVVVSEVEPAAVPLTAPSHDRNVTGPAPPVAHFLVTPPEGPFAPEALASTADDLLRRYRRVLLRVPAGMVVAGLESHNVAVVGAGETVTAAGVELVIRGWTGDGSRPGRGGVVSVPALTQSEERMLAAGLLAPTAPASGALGWAARHLCGLKVGLALGAGGAKGYGHVGAIRALRRLGVPIDYLAGTSIGACVASMAANGVETEDMLPMLDEAGAATWHPTVPTSSVLSSRRLGGYFRRITEGRRIEDLSIPLALVAADILSQREVIFTSGLVWPAMLASVSIPGIFPPQRMGPYLLVDGGVVNPVPADVAARLGADTVIAIRLARRGDPPPVEVESYDDQAPAGEKTPWLFQTLMRSIEIMQTRMATGSRPSVIPIELDFSAQEDPGLRHFSRGRSFVELGEAAIHEAVPSLNAALPWLGAARDATRI
ncbi:MAG TPA: patatin-like phospholipase family protein [Chloroflexota bacterium]|nr:patatin-like phospholipase family protein [Chloroflexota bacterium]